jgi:multiple sugar transport system substrate-binding protein
VHIKVWAWYPSFKEVVRQFNQTHEDVQVDWVQAGVGQDEYTKLKTALKAGQGAPDVVMLEFQELPTIQLTKGLVDMGRYGANEDKGDYVPWAWQQSSDGDHVYAIPVDAGPMAMMYRADIFAEHHLKVPTTWDEYRQAAVALHAADPKAYITDFGSDESAAGWLQGPSGRPAPARTPTRPPSCPTSASTSTTRARRRCSPTGATWSRTTSSTPPPTPPPTSTTA